MNDESSIGENELQSAGKVSLAFFGALAALLAVCASILGILARLNERRARLWWRLTVPTVCNWYHKDVRTLHRAPLKWFGHLTSHGMCKECAEKMAAQVRAMTAK
jgi:aminoglycoside/choline kinase family phosphotransferase